ncbi:MAG: FkbM family methyltransferase [Planctomycetaceae bacterium]
MDFAIDHDGRQFAFHTYSTEDAIARRMRKYGTFYERDLLDYSHALLTELPRGGIVVDIGANFGNHSVFWAAYANRPVVSIEANPALQTYLQGNLTANAAATQFQVIAGGAGEQSGLGRVRPAARAPDQFGLAQVESVDFVRAGEDGVFEVHPLPEWLRRAGVASEPVRLLKIDVEGAEIPVLTGAAAVLERDRPEIFAEAATDSERDALDAALRPWGYRRVKRFCSTPTWHYSTQSNPFTLFRWRRMGDVARLNWRLAKLRHSVVSRLPRAS